MTCIDCKQSTLSDGICVDCSNKRFDDYPRLKEQLKIKSESIENMTIIIMDYMKDILKLKTEKNTLVKEIEAVKDVINIMWNEKQELCKYIDQLKRSHQNIAESIAKILGLELNYD